MATIKATTLRYGRGYETHSYTMLDYEDSLPDGEVYQVEPDDESRAQCDDYDFPGGIEFFEIERPDEEGNVDAEYVCRPNLNGRYTVDWEDDIVDVGSFQEAKDLFEKYKNEGKTVYICDHQSDNIVMQYSPDIDGETDI